MDMCERPAAGPARGLGAAPVIAVEASRQPELIAELVRALKDERPLVQNRAARALKKLQEAEPRVLDAWAKPLVQITIACEDLRTRWNLLLVCGNLHLHGRTRALAVDLMFEGLNDTSALVRTFALQGLFNLGQEDTSLRKQVQSIIQAAFDDPSPAMRARARKLVRQRY